MRKRTYMWILREELSCGDQDGGDVLSIREISYVFLEDGLIRGIKRVPDVQVWDDFVHIALEQRHEQLFRR